MIAELLNEADKPIEVVESLSILLEMYRINPKKAYSFLVGTKSGLVISPERKSAEQIINTVKEEFMLSDFSKRNPMARKIANYLLHEYVNLPIGKVAEFLTIKREYSYKLYSVAKDDMQKEDRRAKTFKDKTHNIIQKLRLMPTKKVAA